MARVPPASSTRHRSPRLMAVAMTTVTLAPVMKAMMAAMMAVMAAMMAVMEVVLALEVVPAPEVVEEWMFGCWARQNG